jgi:hypothetical protein
MLKMGATGTKIYKFLIFPIYATRIAHQNFIGVLTLIIFGYKFVLVSFSLRIFLHPAVLVFLGPFRTKGVEW